MKVLVRGITNLSKNIKEIFLKFPELKNLNNKKVVVKPNWVAPRAADTGVTTDLRLVEEVIVQLKKRSAKVLIAESSGYEFDPKKTNRILKVDNFAKRYKIPIINTRSCQTKTVDIEGKILKKIRLPREVLEADLVFNLPKLKTHMLTDVSLALKNFFGLIPLKERRRAHVFGLDQAIVDLASYFTDRTFVIVDGMTAMVGTGPVFGNVLRSNVLIASGNCLAADLACCRMAKIDFKKITHLRLAYEQRGNEKLQIIGDKEFKIKNFELPKFPMLYRLGYRSVFALEEFLRPFLKGSLVAEVVTRFGARPEIVKDKARGGMRRKLINICPVGAITKDLKIDFEKCRRVRCLRCYDKFPRAVKLKGISKPKR